MVSFYKGLVDHLGRPIEKKALTGIVAGPTTTGVRSPITGYPAEGLTPARLTAILREADQGQPLRFYELAEAIEEKDLHYAAVLSTRKLSVAQIDISVEPAADDAAAVEQAEMIEDWLTRDELQGEMLDMLDAIGKGESFTEIIWDSSEGDWVPERLERRDQRWFRPSRHDLETPMLITGAGEDEVLPGGKIIHMVARGKSGIPARSGLARLASWFWLFKAMTTRDWAMYVATFGQPLRVGKYGPNASEPDKDTLFRAVSSIAGDCAAIIPDSMLIEFVQPPAGGATDLFERRADWLDRQMSKATLGQTTTTDAVSGGHAVSQEHRQVQEDIERADAKRLAGAINRDLVRVWIDLQYGPQESYPRVVLARPEKEDLAQLSTSLAQLVPLGLRVSAQEVRGKFGLSDPKADEELLEKPEPKPVPPPRTDPRKDHREPGDAAEGDDEGSAHQETDPGVIEAERAAAAIDALAADTGDRAAEAMNAMLDLVGEIVRDASSLEDVRQRLLAEAPQISTRSLALALRQALVVARLTGRSDLVED
jgi:phage gp29-like protein